MDIKQVAFARRINVWAGETGIYGKCVRFE
jgi:hypothetical protein